MFKKIINKEILFKKNIDNGDHNNALAFIMKNKIVIDLAVQFV